jgi:S-adenosylmethionine hydrolase
MAGATTATLTVPMLAYRDGNQYKCVITDQYGNVITSDPAKLTQKKDDVTITDHPEDVEVAVGENAVFTVVLSKDEGVTYQWYYSDNGTDWAKTGMTGATTATLTVPMLAYRDGYQYKCVITDQYGNVITSDPATMHLANGQ